MSMRGANDKLIWVKSSKGNFNVKSAYFLDTKIKRQDRGQTSYDVVGEIQWKKMWQLQVPSTMKQFLWKALNDILPTKASLAKKKIINDGFCPVCLQEEETILHVL